ncbi:hypothetical protein ASA1KI_20810 [Opitutales bacterium ASA1]|uniref:phage portal protein family protein n=1 Tax=Congregicoccus parvus TaxID=3081749 RepID=UPI002B3081D6|nr:hypothetical protein ASA1KI_20810 [Opitutales bacterium ASA1]
MKLFDRIAHFAAAVIEGKGPRTGRITRFDVRSLPTGIARDLDVDRVHQILQSAEGGQLTDLFRLYRDIIATNAHLQGRFSDRKRAVYGDVLTIQPIDKRASEDVKAADFVRETIEACACWEDVLIHVLDSTLYPVAVVEKVFKQSGRRYELAELVPVPHDLLDWTEGRLRIQQTDAQGRPIGLYHEADPAAYIVARVHDLTLPDQWGGPMRSLVFWWLLATMDRDWWARFLDRYGAPFLVGKYDQADDDSRGILERAFSLATKLGGLVVSRETDIEIKQAASTDSAEGYAKFHTLCAEEISKLIVGQTLSSDAKSTGLGSGVANAQAAIRDDIRQADARRLGNVLRQQLFAQLCAINALRGRPPKPVWGTISVAEQKATGDMLTSLKTAGLRISDEALEPLSERLGLQLERAEEAPAAPAGRTPFGLSAFAASVPETGEERILRGAVADLARTLGRDFAPVAQLIASSNSPDDALARVEAFCARYRPAAGAKIVEEVTLALAANGTVTR